MQAYECLGWVIKPDALFLVSECDWLNPCDTKSGLKLFAKDRMQSILFKVILADEFGNVLFPQTAVLLSHLKIEP